MLRRPKKVGSLGSRQGLGGRRDWIRERFGQLGEMFRDM